MKQQYQDAATEMCEDWKPVKYWQNPEIEMIWFTRKQLEQFVKFIVDSENENKKNEK